MINTVPKVSIAYFLITGLYLSVLSQNYDKKFVILALKNTLLLIPGVIYFWDFAKMRPKLSGGYFWPGLELKNRIGRRNISSYLRAEYYFKVIEWEEERERARNRKRGGQGGILLSMNSSEAKANQGLSKGRGKKGFVNSQNLMVDTTKELARKLKR